MAEFLVAARDLPSGYTRGDPITAQRNGHPWGSGEGLLDFIIVKIPGLDMPRARVVVEPLVEAAQSGDDEFTAEDVEDRVIVRGRARVRFDLDAIGQLQGKLTVVRVRSLIRKLTFDRATQKVEVTDETEF